MIGNLYRSNNRSNHSRSKLLGGEPDFKSPFMYRMDDSANSFGDFSQTTNCHKLGLPGKLLDKQVAQNKKENSNQSATKDKDDDESSSSCGSTSSDDSATSFAEDYTISVSMSESSSVLVGDDEDLDELEKALEQFALKEETQAAKVAKEAKVKGAKVKEAEKDNRRRRSTGGAREMKTAAEKVSQTKKASRRTRSLGNNGNLLPALGSEHSKTSGAASSIRPSRSSKSGGSNTADKHQSTTGGRPALKRQNSGRSVGSNKSLPLSQLAKKVPEPAGKHSNGSFTNSNRSMMSLCSPREQLEQVFGTLALPQNGFNWKTYFHSTDKYAIMTPEVERAIKSKTAKKLRRLLNKGVSMQARNIQGETVAHMVCRQGSSEQLAFLMTEAKVSVRVQDVAGKSPLHEVSWNPVFQPGLAMMLMSDSPELLFATDQRGFLALDYVPRRCQYEWYDFLEVKQPILKLALQFSRFKASSETLNANQNRLKEILEQRLLAQ